MTKKGFMFYFVRLANFLLTTINKGDTLKALYIKN